MRLKINCLRRRIFHKTADGICKIGQKDADADIFRIPELKERGRDAGGIGQVDPADQVLHVHIKNGAQPEQHFQAYADAAFLEPRDIIGRDAEHPGKRAPVHAGALPQETDPGTDLRTELVNITCFHKNNYTEPKRMNHTAEGAVRQTFWVQQEKARVHEHS